MEIGVVLMMLVTVAVVIGVSVMSYKMLVNVRKQEALERKQAGAPERQLHPKIKQQPDQNNK